LIFMPYRSPPAILLVDDNADVRGSAAEVLRRAGFDVWEAAGGAEALRRVRDRPNLVLLDVCLPDLSGFEVCRAIRADPDTASIPILHLSGAARTSEDRTQGLDGGADGYLVKPVDAAELVAHVRALLRLRRAEEALRESEERYRLIAENASAAVIVLDEQSTILFANRSAEGVFGYTPDELINQKLTLLMDEPMCARHLAGLARYLATGQRGCRWDGMEVQGRHRSGREITLEVSYGEYRDRKGRRRFVGVAQDVTARREAEQALATLSRKLLEVQEAERRHIAHELHDEVGQTLTALKITLHTAQQLTPESAAAPFLRDALSQLDRTMQELRTLSRELRPPMMDDLGLVAALRWHLNGVTERTGLAVRLEAGSFGRLPAEVEMACFRVVQEALNNAVKHARAASATVELRQEGDELHLAVRDDGVGFDAARARRRAGRGLSLGLLGMQERVVLLGGQFGIRSAPGEGTEVRARFPLDSTGPSSEQREESP
jgi:PAS domain S-box-containing protein